MKADFVNKVNRFTVECLDVGDVFTVGNGGDKYMRIENLNFPPDDARWMYVLSLPRLRLMQHMKSTQVTLVSTLKVTE